jgi:hypothetical protein
MYVEILLSASVRYRQGDQIGRILAHWAIVYFGQVSENYKISRHFGQLFFLRESYL